MSMVEYEVLNAKTIEMKIIVTGSSGYLGEALMLTLKATNHHAIGLDIKAGKYTDEVGTIADGEWVKHCLEGVDVVFHAATLHKPHVATHSKHAFVDSNITGTLNLLEASKSADVKAFIFTSTTSTFGDAMRPSAGEPAVWVTEEVVPSPKNIYGVTKTAAEDLCQLFHRNYDLPCLILRTSRFFPEADDNKIVRASYQDKNIKANELLYRRVDIEDVVSAHLLAMKRAPEIGFGKYIISATTPFTQNDLALLNSNAPAVVRQKYPDFEDLYAKEKWKMFQNIGRVYVNERARLELGWQPKYDFGHVLGCLKKGIAYTSHLTLQVGPKSYHPTSFDDGPYPV